MANSNVPREIVEQTRQHAEMIGKLGEAWVATLAAMVDMIVTSLKSGGKVLIAGNGGSAADAQHVAGEFVSRYRRERQALPAIALTTDTSILTSIGNDYTFDRVFSRQVEALGQPGDVLWLFSTSGTSKNILAAAEMARSRKLHTIGFTGGDGGLLAKAVEVALVVPEKMTGRIQEGHMLAYHIVCDLVEEAMAGE